MRTRLLGRTGVPVTEVGLGCEWLENQPYEVVEEVVEAALAAGINIFDVFMSEPNVRDYIGKALGSRRKKVLLQGHIGSVDLKQQYDISRDLVVCKRYFENLLRRLNTDYIDFGMLFFIDSMREWQTVLDNGILDYAQDLKRRGTVRSLGASSHHPDVARHVVETGVIDLLMFSLNPAFDQMPPVEDIAEMLGENMPSPGGMNPQRADLYQACARRGVAVTAMKTLGAGKLLSAELSPFAQPLTVGQCIHYALTRPAVVSALVGAASREQMEDALGYLSLTDAERDYSAVIRQPKDDFRGRCVYCNHCLPCPAGIDVAAVHRALDAALLTPESVPAAVKDQYAALGRHGSDCVDCGHCGKRCPFGVPAAANMKRAVGIFGC